MDAVKNEIALSESSSLSPAQKRFLEALRGTLGNVSEACSVTGTARATHYLWRKSRAYAEAVEEIEEAAVDRAESALFRLIEEGNVPAVIFFLKTKGKKRGYTEKAEITTDREPVFVFTEIVGSRCPLATDD
jgi:hypothetical protein